MKTANNESIYTNRVTFSEATYFYGEDVESLRTKAFARGAQAQEANFPEENVVILRATNARHLMDAVENGFWDHTRNATQVKAGTRVYVISSKKTGCSLGITFIANDKMQEAAQNRQDWTETKCAA